MTTYNKPFLTIDKQIALFKERGLKIEDKKRAEFLQGFAVALSQVKLGDIDLGKIKSI